MTAAPAASIIVATYNRPYVLRHCIASVLQSSYADWELIVVGDGCTDETADVVAEHRDPRIQFVNLPVNSGGQAVPNNAGLERARGRFVYFLNHDDLYFPDHLSRSVAFMETTQAEVSWSPVFVLKQTDVEAGLPEPGRDVVEIDGAACNGRLDFRSFMIASSWAVRRDAFLKVGPWRGETTSRLSPSQEWLFRAHRQGRRFAYNPHISVLCLHGGQRRFSYLVRRSPEHERAATWIAAGESARGLLLECAAVDQAAKLVQFRWKSWRPPLTGPLSAARAAAVEGLRRVGFHPVAVERLLAREPKGDWIARVRRFTGEAPELHHGETLRAGDPLAMPFFGRGWHDAEPEGRWSAAGHAEVLFSVRQAGDGCALEICGRSLRPSDQVAFELNGRPMLTATIESGPTVTRLPIDGRGSFWLRIAAQSPATPHDVLGSDDMRVLGFQLLWLRLVAAEPAGSHGPGFD